MSLIEIPNRNFHIARLRFTRIFVSNYIQQYPFLPTFKKKSTEYDYKGPTDSLASPPFLPPPPPNKTFMSHFPRRRTRGPPSNSELIPPFQDLTKPNVADFSQKKNTSTLERFSPFNPLIDELVSSEVSKI